MSLSGLYNTVSIQQIISSAKMNLRIESSDDDIFFVRLANEGARHFDSLDTFIKRNCRLTINDGKAKLPNGFVQLLALRPCGSFEVGAGLVYVDQPWLNSNGINGIFVFSN